MIYQSFFIFKECELSVKKKNKKLTIFLQNNKNIASSITDTYGNRPYVCFRKGGNRLIEKEKSSNQIPSFPHRL
ncbi:MAG: hypothetical protein PHH86_08160, partial [Sphaerochaetaceae bacterium]|nr:hypothetical protein [Sphaerochaetaceae bacterium]